MNNFEEQYNTLQYDRQLSKLNPENQKVIDWVGTNKRVLEIGCHTGYLSYWLIKHKCIVDGVEINKNAIERAKPNLTNIYIGNIESIDLAEKLKNNKYDYIICMHVLEHLVNPWKTLSFLKSLLQSDGKVIIALPNICNMRTRMELFAGHFNYTNEGVMDKTHLRFFTYDSALEMITDAQLKLIEYYAPSKTNPLAEIIKYIPLLKKVSNLLFKKNIQIKRFNRNSTDIVMMFFCEKESL